MAHTNGKRLPTLNSTVFLPGFFSPASIHLDRHLAVSPWQPDGIHLLKQLFEPAEFQADLVESQLSPRLSSHIH